MTSDLLTKVHLPPGPISPDQVLPGMDVTVGWPDPTRPAQLRRLRGRVSHSTLMGVSLHTDTRGEHHLTRSFAQPPFQITLETPFEDVILLPGTIAAGADVRGSWAGLWVADSAGRWEAARPGPSLQQTPQLATLQRAHLASVPVRPDEDIPWGELALVTVAGRSGAAIRWPGSWRAPAWSYTSSDAHTQVLARLQLAPSSDTAAAVDKPPRREGPEA